MAGSQNPGLNTMWCTVAHSEFYLLTLSMKNVQFVSNGEYFENYFDPLMHAFYSFIPLK